jgi:hypothetical protein
MALSCADIFMDPAASTAPPGSTGVFMLEMLDPAQTAHYERVATVENLKKYVAELV